MYRGELKVSEVIECHGAMSYGWHYRDMFRHCGYCGSLHPEDLADILVDGGTAGESDWKYGWPHKHYITLYSGDYAGKWYNRHLEDLEDDASFNIITKMLEKHTHIEWTRNESGIYWNARREGGTH